MKLKIILLFMLTALAAPSFGQSPDWAWAKNYGRTDYGLEFSTCCDAMGNVYVTGDFIDSTFNLGDTTLRHVDTNRFQIDMFIIKYNSSGQLLWAKALGGPRDDMVTNIQADQSGNIYITGWYFSDSIFFDSYHVGQMTGKAAVKYHYGINENDTADVFVAKLNPGGQVQWASSIGGIYTDETRCMAIDKNDNVYIGGEFESPTLVTGSTTLTNGGGADGFVTKFNSAGIPQWSIGVAGKYEQYITGIVPGKGGDFFITGIFDSANIKLGSTTLANLGGNDILLAHYGSSGNLIWAKEMGGFYDDYGYDLAINPANELFITGSFESPSIKLGNTTLTNMGAPPGESPLDIFIAKLDTMGNFSWAKSAGGYSGEVSLSLAADNSGNSFITGGFASASISFDNTILICQDSGYNPADAFVAKYDINGNTVWAKSAGGIHEDFGTRVATDGQNNIYVAGFFTSRELNFGNIILKNTDTIVSHIQTNFFIAKISDIPLGINKREKENSVSVFPNPSSGNVTVSIPEDSKEVQIFNSLGQLVNSIITHGKKNLNFSLDGEGLYFMRVITTGGIITNKLIINE